MGKQRGRSADANVSSLLQLEFVRDRESKGPFDPSLGLAMQIHEEGILQDPGVMMYPGTGSVDGRVGDHIIFAPPYNVTAEEIDMIVNAAHKAIMSTFKRLQTVPDANGA